MKPVTDPAILSLLESGPRRVTDPTMLAQLEAEDTPEQDGILRQLGLTARAGLGGVAKAFTGVNDAVNLAANEAMRMAGIDYQQSMTSQLVDSALDSAGLPQPQNAIERGVNMAGEFVAGGAVPMGVGGQLARTSAPVASHVGGVLASNPAIQGVSNAMSGGALSAAQDADMSPAGQMGTSLAAGLVPGLGIPATQGAYRLAIRGNDPSGMQKNIAAFNQAGTSPSVGQATQSRRAQVLESVLAKTPGGAGPLKAHAERQSSQVGDFVDTVADTLGRKSSPERAGQAVERGISGPGGFVERFKLKATQLYDAVDQYINPASPIALNNTKAVFATPDALTQNAPNTAKRLNSTYLESLGIDLSDDIKAHLDRTGFDGLPYAAVKAIRTKVGERMDNVSLVTDVSQKQLSKLYGALSEDMTAAARLAGPQAEAAANRANAFYRAGRERVETLQRVVNKQGGPEKIFAGLMSGTQEGATTLRTVMKSLQPEERAWVASTVIRRMGKATAGNQDDLGEKFSLATYLTNWNRLSPEAKGTLLSGQNPNIARATDAIAKVASNVKEGSKVFANPSGTQPALSAQATGIGAVAALAYGDLTTFSIILSAAAGENGAARLMTNQNFVNWLAKSTQIPKGAVSAAINELGQIAAHARDTDMAELASALQGY